MSDKAIYLDNAATSFAHKSVLDTFNKYLVQFPGNPSSIHKYGQDAKRILDKSRNVILSSLNLTDSEVIFTSGATEANNLALKGVCLSYKNRGNHIIVTEIEHPSVLETVKELEKDFGFEATYLHIDKNGNISLEELKNSIKDRTILVSVMAVNNEIGSVNDIKGIKEILREYPKVIFHVDAVQAIGKIPFDYSLPDLLTIAGHKIHALIGCGCLIKKQNIKLVPVNNGGGQEFGLRSGTVSLPLNASLAIAIKEAISSIDSISKQSMLLAKKVYKYLTDNPDLYEINSNIDVNPHILNFSFKKHKASVVVEALSERNIMVSSISACHSKGEAISYVVFAQKHDEILAHNTMRLSFSDQNTEEEIDEFIKNLDEIVRHLKQ